MKLVIGSRGSQLALAQTHAVRALLHEQHPDLDVQVQIVRTTGDEHQGSLQSFGGQGVFTKELENALLDGRIDLAVHSLKDLPTRTHPDLALVACPPREDVRDVLIARDGLSLKDLPSGARLGTGSLRRQAQLLALRPDVQITEIRGNLDTRLGKVERGEYHGVVLAAAGLHRLGWRERITLYLDTAQMLPAVGQAALGLQMRAADPLRQLVAALDHSPTLAAVTAERCLLHALGAGCHAPVAAWGRVEEGLLVLDGLVGRPDGTLLLRQRLSGPPEAPQELGDRLAEALLGQGAHAILAKS